MLFFALLPHGLDWFWFVGMTAVWGFWIFQIVDCATKEPNEGNTKIVWLLIIIFLHFLGALLYFLIRRPERIAKFGR